MTQTSQSLSNRPLGAVFVVFFSTVAAWSWWRGGMVYPWASGLAMLTLVVTLTRPGWLAPLNRAWMVLADVLHRIVSPVVLGIMFFGMFTPVGWAMRLARRDALKRRFDPNTASYWVPREPPGPDPSGLPNQF